METVGSINTFRATLAAKQWLAPGVLEIRLSRPAGLSFIPGQFIRFLMDGYQRDYTMVSSPNADTMDFCIALVPQGLFTKTIQKAEIGDVFSLSGPHGYFVYQGDVNPAVFVTTGTGIAPIVAFSRAGFGDAILLHGVKSSDQLIYRDMLSSATHNYVPCVSQLSDDADDPEGIYMGRVTDYLSQNIAPGVYDFYLCGRRPMIVAATAIIDSRFPGSRLFSEAYD